MLKRNSFYTKNQKQHIQLSYQKLKQHQNRAGVELYYSQFNCLYRNINFLHEKLKIYLEYGAADTTYS